MKYVNTYLYVAEVKQATPTSKDGRWLQRCRVKQAPIPVETVFGPGNKLPVIPEAWVNCFSSSPEGKYKQGDVIDNASLRYTGETYEGADGNEYRDIKIHVEYMEDVEIEEDN